MAVRIRTVAWFTLLPVAAGTMMWILGSAHGDHRAETAREARQADLDAYQAAHMQELAVGRPLPPFLVTGPDGKVRDVYTLLPDGLLIVYVSSGCESCFDVADALGIAQRRLGPDALPAILIVDGDSRPLRTYCDDRGHSIPIYEDTERAFATRFRVLTYPSHILVAPDGTVTAIGAGLNRPEDFARILAHGRTRPEQEILNREGR